MIFENFGRKHKVGPLGKILNFDKNKHFMQKMLDIFTFSTNILTKICKF
jgi:hypothetical protein